MATHSLSALWSFISAVAPPNSQSASHTFMGQGSPSPTATVPGSPLRGAERKLGVGGSHQLGLRSWFSRWKPPFALPKTMPEGFGLTQVGQIIDTNVKRRSPHLACSCVFFSHLCLRTPWTPTQCHSASRCFQTLWTPTTPFCHQPFPLCLRISWTPRSASNTVPFLLCLCIPRSPHDA
ncbi:hypothetical protein F5887DRAFT_995588, partial [Amanita rubescens]